MPTSRITELREMTDDELVTRLGEARQELFNLRFQHVTGQLDNYSRLGQLRKDIARIETLLREDEIAAAEAAEAEAAFEDALEHRPDVVLLDIGLPGMDGYEVAQHLRALEGLDQALLVALTGYGQEDDVRRSREAGFDHHLVKPADPADLQALLRSRAAPRDGPDSPGP